MLHNAHRNISNIFGVLQTFEIFSFKRKPNIIFVFLRLYKTEKAIVFASCNCLPKAIKIDNKWTEKQQILISWGNQMEGKSKLYKIPFA